MNSTKLPGYDKASVEQWISSNVDGLTPPLSWTRLEGGHSNLTYLIVDQEGRRAVIRRPPEGELLAGAHDMSREWSLVSALYPTAVPVPEPIGFCDDPNVTGAWFYLMGFVNGEPLYNEDDTTRLIPESSRVSFAKSFIETIAALHTLQPDDIGLSGLGKTDSYVGRQLKTWYRSWTSSVADADYDDPRAHELRDFFLHNLPEQGPVSVVHGDFGVHNVLVGPDFKVAAVVDWEIATLGDPIADLAYALNQWPQPEEETTYVPTTALTQPGFPPRSTLADWYADISWRDISKLDYYYAFNHWKTAAISHGVYARYRAGKKSAEGLDLDERRAKIGEILTQAERAVNRLS